MVWDELSEDTVGAVITDVPSRLRGVIKNGGGSVEKSLFVTVDGLLWSRMGMWKIRPGRSWSKGLRVSTRRSFKTQYLLAASVVGSKGSKYQHFSCSDRLNITGP